MASFHDTNWFRLKQAVRTPPSARSRAALESVCRAYRPPLLSQLRRWGHSPEESEDLVQGFLLYVISSRALAKANPRRGRFRNFLLGILKRFVAHEQRDAARQKRGGGCVFLSLSEVEIAQPSPADSAFDLAWARQTARDALALLRAEYSPPLFRALAPHCFATGKIPYRQMSRRLHRPIPTLRSDLRRFRQRYLILLRAELQHTSPPDRIDEELRYLKQILLDQS